MPYDRGLEAGQASAPSTAAPSGSDAGSLLEGHDEARTTLQATSRVANDPHRGGAASARADPATDFDPHDETAGRDLASEQALTTARIDKLGTTRYTHGVVVKRARARFLFRGATVASLLGALAAAACGADSASTAESQPPIPDAAVKKDSPAPTDTGTTVTDATPDADGAAWPTCDTKPPTASAKTIPQIWQADPPAAVETWVPGVYVSAISGSACIANKACQLFVQTDLSYPSLAAAAKHSIKVFVSAAASSHFTSVVVGDRIDVLGWAWRYDINAQDELLLQVNAQVRGCAKTTSSGNALVPLAGLSLSDLTLDKYENTHGPLFVRIASVLGKPDPSPTATFGLFHATEGGLPEAGADAGAGIVSLSPFFLPGSTFMGLTPVLTAFSSLTGVFATFVSSTGTKYLEIYPRNAADIVKQ